jgi:Rrf2 family cysteine metabolism transcriptional repressor
LGGVKIFWKSVDKNSYLVYNVYRLDYKGDIFMKLTTKSEYSILALIHIARNEKRGFIKIEEICGKCDIPKKYMELLFGVLRQSGYIKTRRGTSGGYKLSKSASKISVAEIIRLMDGPLAPVESVSRYFYSETPLSREKKVIKVFKEIRDYVAKRLEKLTLADLV